MNLDKFTWQQIETGLWVFGALVRGFVRVPLAEVTLGGASWYWRVAGRMGTSQNLRDAITESEKILAAQDDDGIK